MLTQSTIRSTTPPLVCRYIYAGRSCSTVLNVPVRFETGDTAYDTDIESEAWADVYSKLQEGKQNLQESFATAQQTVDLVAQTATTLATWFRNLKRGKFPPNSTKAVVSAFGKGGRQGAANAWLQYRYGWLPMLSDIYTLSNLPQVVYPPPMWCEGRASSNRQRSEEFESGYLQNISYKGVYTTDIQCSCCAKVQVTIDDPFSHYWVNGLGLANPALLLWDLLPYSFVVDWFLPIGTWLDSQTALVGLKVLQASTTRTAKAYQFAHVLAHKTNSTGITSLSGATKVAGFRLAKSRTTGVQSPPLPRLKNPLSFKHCLDALALMQTAFKT